jgi:hypothetical protein
VWVFALQLFFHRRRKMFARLGILLALGLGGLAAVLPRADVHDASRTMHDASRTMVADMGSSRSLLLLPEPMSGERFSVFYAIVHR